MMFYLRTLIKALPLLIPLIPALLIQQYRLPLTTLYLFLFFVVEYFAIYRPEKAFESKRRRLMDAFFSQWVEGSSYGGQTPRIRINVMLVRWHWVGRHFFQVYNYEMRGWPDADLHFSVKKGFCGQCYAQGAPDTYYVDLRRQSSDDIKATYKLTEEEYRKTQHIRAIACRVLSKPTWKLLPRQAVGYKYFGVLNVDAVDDDGADFLQQQEVLDAIANFGTWIEVIHE